MYGHQHALFEENIHVPWLVHNAGVNARVSEPISLTRLPAVLEDCATGEPIDPSEWTDEYAFSRTEDSSMIAARGERWKYVDTGDEELLFDLESDPGEQTDVSKRETSTLEGLRSVVRSHRESLSHEDVVATDEENDELHERLDALGYVG